VPGDGKVIVRVGDGEDSVIEWRGGKPSFLSAHRLFSSDRTWQADVEAGEDGSGNAIVVGGSQIAGGGNIRLVAALGDGPRRVVVYIQDAVYVARSVDGGATWSRVKVPTGRGTTVGTSDARDACDVVWFDGEHTRWLHLTAANAERELPEAIAVSQQEHGQTCGGNPVWLSFPDGDRHVLWRLGHGYVARFPTRPDPLACRDDRVVVDVDGAYHACDVRGCKLLPKTPRRGALVGDRIARTTIHPHDPVFAVWLDGDPPTYYRVPDGWTMNTVIDAGGRAMALLTKGDRFEIGLFPLN
jgi:hypothetical protein